MMKRKPQITIEENIIYLTIDLKGLDLYERGKTIRRFINSDTKIVQDYVDMLCVYIFKKNGINVLSMDKSALERAFDSLKAKGKKIDLTDIYKNKDIWHSQILDSKDYITIVLEENRYLIAGVEVVEKKI